MSGPPMNQLLRALTRRKYQSWRPELDRHIGIAQLTVICIGCVIGSGIYVTSGIMIREQAGPAAAVSVLLVGVFSILIGFVYAEVGTRCPRSGSFYVFAYSVCGEMVAFLVGLLLLLSYMLGAVAIARSWSHYINSLSHGKIYHSLRRLKLFESAYVPAYFDPIPGLVIAILSVLFWGENKNSWKVTIFFVLINISVIVTVIISGSRIADLQYWHLSPSDCGGFAPFGVGGILSATMGAFFSLSGVDVVGAIAGNITNPGRTIPISTISSILISTVAYFAVTLVLSLMTPYYSIAVDAPFAAIFLDRRNYGLFYAISLGCICGMTSSLYGDLLSGGQIVYSMAEDDFFPYFLKHCDPAVMTRRSGLWLCFVSALFSPFLTTIIAVNVCGISILLTVVVLNILLWDLRYSAKSAASPRRVRNARIMISTLTVLSLLISVLLRGQLGSSVARLSVISTLSVICAGVALCLTQIPHVEEESGIFLTPFVPYFPFAVNMFTFVILAHIESRSWIVLCVIVLFCFVGYLGMTVIGWHRARGMTEMETLLNY